jgi:hypothetical protein
MFNDLLPIGSVVLLKGGAKKLMIIGIKQVKTDEVTNETQEFDYISVLYPEGFLGAEGNFLFNHADVNDVVFTGYQNPERADFISFLEETFKSSLNNSIPDKNTSGG